jgi:hypothetical protein
LKTFDFLVDQLPFGYAYNFDNYLFNKIKHINTQGIEHRADYFIINNVKKRIEGKIHFLIKDKTAYSPYRSLFGSFEFSPRIHPNLLSEFWSFIEGDLINRGIQKCNITNPAECYAPRKAGIVHKMLQNHGFSSKRKAVNHHIVINENPLQDSMHPMEIRRLNKCKEQGFAFAEEPNQNAEEVYDYLSLCREEQGLRLSISKHIFFRYMDEFPQNYPLFTIRDSKDIVAATVAIKVHRKILYSFLPGSLRKYKHYSPTVLLNEGLYTYCQDHQIAMLDLGISTEKDGKDQESLIAFKERMGGEKSYKYFLEKEL